MSAPDRIQTWEAGLHWPAPKRRLREREQVYEIRAIARRRLIDARRTIEEIERLAYDDAYAYRRGLSSPAARLEAIVQHINVMNMNSRAQARKALIKEAIAEHELHQRQLEARHPDEIGF